MVPQLILDICWNPREVGFSVSVGISVLTRWKQVGKEWKNPSFFHYPYIGIQQKVWSWLKVCLSASRSGFEVCVTLPQKSKSKGVCHPTSRIRSKISYFLLQELHLEGDLHFWIVVDSRYSQVDNQKQPHISSIHNVILDTIEKCERSALRRDFICELWFCSFSGLQCAVMFSADNGHQRASELHLFRV